MTDDLSQCKNCIYHYTYNGKDMCKQVGDDFYLQWKVEDCPYHTTIISATKISDEIYRLRAENAALRERLGRAVELPFYVFDKKTGKEADEYEIALNEDWAKHLMYCDMDGFAIEHDGTLMLIDECGQHAYCPSDRFEICNEARLKELKGGEE